MATRAVAMTIPFVAWDTSANAGKTGDSANITPRWIKDGTIAALTTATVTELDATNAPGLYKCSISSTEADCDIGVLCGKSSTANISFMPVTIQFERLPNAAPDAAGGLPISDAGGLDLDTLLGYLTGAVATASALATAQTDLDTLTGADGVIIASGTQTFNITGNITGNLSGSVGSVTGAVGSVTGITASGVTLAAGTHNPQTGDSYARLGAPAGASVSADIATVDSNVDAILLDTAEIGAAGAGLTAVPWNAAWDAEVQSEVNDGLVAFWTSPATLVDLVWDEAQSGHVGAGTFGEIATEIASILDDTGTSGVVVAAGSKTGYSLVSTGLDLVTTWTVAITGNITGNLSGSVGSVSGAVGSVTGAVGSVTGAVGSVTAAVTVGTINDGAIDATVVADIFSTTALTEAYAADGAAGTPAQLLYEICQSLTEFAISSTTISVKKRDGSTEALTFTLDDATTPTSRTRAT